MSRHSITTRGFTLVEVMVAMLVLFMGVTASLVLVLTGLSWGHEVRDRTVALETARSCMVDPGIISPGSSFTDPRVEGYVNGFYAVRTTDPYLEVKDRDGTRVAVDLTDHYGQWRTVRLKLYAQVSGTSPSPGDLADADLLWDLSTTMYQP